MDAGQLPRLYCPRCERAVRVEVRLVTEARGYTGDLVAAPYDDAHQLALRGRSVRVTFCPQKAVRR